MTYTSFDSVFDRLHYPAGESHLRLRPGATGDHRPVIEVRATGFETIGELLTAERVARRHGISPTWFVPYFPFARHDRRIDCMDGLEIEVALDLARPLDLLIADPHSDVAGMLPHIGQAAAVREFATNGLFDDDPIVVIPDVGAAKKTYEWLAGRDAVQATKRRDPHTGRLSGFEVPTTDLHGRPCVIVDDICDGGGTFLGLADELRAANAGPLRLAVTHGLFTKGTAALTAAFGQVFTFTFVDDDPAADGVIGLPFRDLYERGTVQ